MNIDINIYPKKTLKILLFFVFFLVAIDIIRIFLHFTINRSFFLWLFAVGRDTSIPTWYAAVTLLICSLLLWVISWIKQKTDGAYIFQWRVLSGIFLILSIDEVSAIHEWIGKRLILIPKSFKLATGGFLNYDWVVFGMFFVLAFLAFYLRFIFDLPKYTKWMFLLSGFIFVGGSIGIEMINARTHLFYGANNIEYQLATTVEELFEMLGIAIFIYALLKYMLSEVKEVSINLNCVESVTVRKRQLTKGRN